MSRPVGRTVHLSCSQSLNLLNLNTKGFSRRPRPSLFAQTLKERGKVWWMLKNVVKNRVRNTVRSALHGRSKACMCVKGWARSGSPALSFSLSAFVSARSCCLAGYVSTMQVMQRSHVRIHAPTGQKLVVQLQAIYQAHCLNLAVSRPLVHVVRNV